MRLNTFTLFRIKVIEMKSGTDPVHGLCRNILLSVSLIALAGCVHTTDTPELTKVELALNWLPEAEHGGYYAALVHGDFEAAGFDVTIIPGGPGVPVIQNVATKRIQFGISNADQILVGRAQEANIVGVFAPLQASPRCVMVHKASGITKFEDLKNLTLAINENSTFGAVLKQQVSLEGCRIVPYPGNVTQFLLNDDFAQQGYVFSEPFVAKTEGGDPHNLMASDIGFNPYTSVLIVHADTISESPELVESFTQAVAQGWKKYLADPTETNQHINAQNPEMSLEILAFGAKELQRLCQSESDDAQIGDMTLARWQQMADMLLGCGKLEADSVKASEAFTRQFLGETASGK
jgi:NitT/TauT family transport system substrate-binding protein